MAKKSRKSLQTNQEPAVQAPATAPKPEPVHQEPVKQEPAVPAVKKRVRVRKKATKHLSVAVLCTNPLTRRFI